MFLSSVQTSHLQCIISQRICFFLALFLDPKNLLSSLSEDDDNDDDCPIDWNEQAAQPILEDLHTALICIHYKPPRTVQILHNITINGLKYTTTSKHWGNSCILSKLCSACMDSEYLPNSFLGFGADSYCNLTSLTLSASSWSFFWIPHLACLAVGAELEDLDIIWPDQILSHFACLALEDEFDNHVVAVSLSHKFVWLSWYNLIYLYSSSIRRHCRMTKWCSII